jgi:hypothetical protein
LPSRIEPLLEFSSINISKKKTISFNNNLANYRKNDYSHSVTCDYSLKQKLSKQQTTWQRNKKTLEGCEWNMENNPSLHFSFYLRQEFIQKTMSRYNRKKYTQKIIVNI